MKMTEQQFQDYLLQIRALAEGPFDEMQKEIEEKQAEIEATLFTSTVGGGAVKAVCTGKKELQELVISPDALNPDDAEMLQDMIISAVNEALRQAEEAMSKTMDGIGSGLNLGAFGL